MPLSEITTTTKKAISHPNTLLAQGNDLIVQVERVAVHLGQMEKRTYSGLQMQFWLPSPSPPLPKIPRLSFPVCTRH